MSASFCPTSALLHPSPRLFQPSLPTQPELANHDEASAGVPSSPFRKRSHRKTRIFRQDIKLFYEDQEKKTGKESPFDPMSPAFQASAVPHETPPLTPRQPNLHVSFEEPNINSTHMDNSPCNSRRNSARSGGSGSSRRQRSRGGRPRLPSFMSGSCESTDASSSSNSSSIGGGMGLAAGKSSYRIMVLGACGVGKTAIIRQFLYDQFPTAHRPTMDDMYRGDFEIYGHNVAFDIQDVSGSYVYEFPGMCEVSVIPADAFVLVYALDDARSWEEVSKLRDMILEIKGNHNDGTPVPMVVVANKLDLQPDPEVPRETAEAHVVFDWENGYVECSAKERWNINSIFKELLQQAKSRYDFTAPQLATAAALLSDSSKKKNNSGRGFEDNLKRRKSMPAVPTGLTPPPTPPQPQTLTKMLLSKLRNHRSVEGSVNASSSPVGSATSSPKVGRRRASLAALRRDSCKIS